MGQHCAYLQTRQWITEGATWRVPETLTLRDDAGVGIPSTQMATLVMTLYDLMDPTYPLVNGVDHLDIKNTRGCTLSPQGVLVVTLLPEDTVILDSRHAYERRRALIEYTWPLTPTKSDALELTVVVRNLTRRP